MQKMRSYTHPWVSWPSLPYRSGEGLWRLSMEVVSVRKGCFAALAVSTFGPACAA